MWLITTAYGIFESKYLSYFEYDHGLKVKRIETLTCAWKNSEEDLLLETPRPEGGCRRILVLGKQIVAIELIDDAEEECE